MVIHQKILFLKEFLACNGCLGLFSKIKKGSWASVWCIFSAWFFHKNVSYLILYQWTKFQCHTLFLSQDTIKLYMLLSAYIDSWWRHDFFDQPLKQWLTGKKRGKDEHTKIGISEEQKELFRCNKKHFS